MAQPTNQTILDFSRQYLQPGLYPGGTVWDQIIRYIGFQGVFNCGTEFAFNRASAGTLPTPAPYSAAGTLGGNAVATSKQTLTLRRVGDYVKIDWSDQVTSTEANDQLEQQAQALWLSIVRKLGSQLIEGDGTAPNLSGLKNQVTAGQTIGSNNGAANGGVPTLEDFSKLVNLVTPSDGFVGGTCDALIGTSKSERQLFRLMYTQGMSVDYRFIPGLDAAVLHFKGKPFLIGQNAENETKGTGTNLTSVYAVKLRGPTGVRMVYAIPKGERPRPYGIYNYLIPPQLTIAELGLGMTARLAVMVPEAESLARMNGIDNSNLI